MWMERRWGWVRGNASTAAVVGSGSRDGGAASIATRSAAATCRPPTVTLRVASPSGASGTVRRYVRVAKLRGSTVIGTASDAARRATGYSAVAVLKVADSVGSGSTLSTSPKPGFSPTTSIRTTLSARTLGGARSVHTGSAPRALPEMARIVARRVTTPWTARIALAPCVLHTSRPRPVTKGSGCRAHRHGSRAGRTSSSARRGWYDPRRAVVPSRSGCPRWRRAS